MQLEIYNHWSMLFCHHFLDLLRSLPDGMYRFSSFREKRVALVDVVLILLTLVLPSTASHRPFL